MNKKIRDSEGCRAARLVFATLAMVPIFCLCAVLFFPKIMDSYSRTQKVLSFVLGLLVWCFLLGMVIVIISNVLVMRVHVPSG